MFSIQYTVRKFLCRGPFQKPFSTSLLIVLLLGLSGCASSEKKSPQELVKLELDAREEAQKLRDRGNLQSAVVKYQEALRYHPGPATQLELGEVYEELGRHEDARRHYELALARNPDMRQAEEAIDRLDARIELAESNRRAPVERVQGSTIPGEEDASALVPRAPDFADSSAEIDVLDQEEAFREMKEITPPPIERGESFADSAGFESTSDARSLAEDAEDLFGLGTGAGRDEAGASSWTATRPDAPVRPGARRTETIPVAQSRSLPGGRGLLQAKGLSSLVLSGPGNRSQPTFDEPAVDRPLPRVAKAQEPRPVQIRPTGRPGERGLARPTDLPEEFSIGRSTADRAPSRPPKPSLSRQAAEGPDPGTGRSPALDEYEPPKRESKGWLSDVFQPDVVEYPSSSGAEVAPPLPPAGNEVEELDLTPGTFRDRFTGRRKKNLDLEICKRRYYEERDLQGAIDCFRDKRIDFPENAELHYELGRIYAAEGNFPSAREEFRLALRYDPGNPAYRDEIVSANIAEARRLSEQGDTRNAFAILRAAIEHDPDRADAHRELAKVYSRDALAKEELIQGGAGDSARLGEAAVQSWSNAEKSYRRALNLSEGSYKDWYNLGVAIQNQYDAGKEPEAIRAYETALEMRPDYWDAHYNLAILYEKRDVARAIDHYQKALGIARATSGSAARDQQGRCLAALGEIYWRKGESDEAAEYLTEYLEIVPDDSHIEEILNQITSAPPIEG